MCPQIPVNCPCSQELLIEEMALRAFQVTHAEQRDTVSYGDVGTLPAEGTCQS